MAKSIPPICIHSIGSNHADGFYYNECRWLLAELEGRLRKISFRNSSDFNTVLIQFIFQTQHFISVWITEDDKLYLMRRRGLITVFIALGDLRLLKRRAHLKAENKRLIKASRKHNALQV